LSERLKSECLAGSLQDGWYLLQVAEAMALGNESEVQQLCLDNYCTELTSNLLSSLNGTSCNVLEEVYEGKPELLEFKGIQEQVV